MANDEHLALLRQESAAWNEWLARNPDIRPDLSNADLSNADLSEADLSNANLNHASLHFTNLFQADLSNANLNHASLHFTNLSKANLTGANLSNASLLGANLSNASLTGANLRFANLTLANLTGANLSAANVSGAFLIQTIFGTVDLTATKGLNECRHVGPSVIDFHTLSSSRGLPLSFLRGCGVPNNLMEYLPSLRGEAIRFYSCFISYSARDQIFADRLHADLQNKGVRCWFAPHDLPIGAKTWDAIDEAIRLREKLLVILSRASIASDWVEDEVNKAYAEERSRKEVVLFPVRIDNAVMSTDEPWTVKLRDQRNIGDFRQWRKPAEYQKSLERLLRDLKASKASGAG